MENYLFGLISLFLIIGVGRILIKTGFLWSRWGSEYQDELESIKKRKRELGIEEDEESEQVQQVDIPLKTTATYILVIMGVVIVTLIVMSKLGYRVF